MKQGISDLINCFDDESSIYDEETNTFHHYISEYVIKENLLNELNGQKQLRILDSGGGTGKYSLILGKLGYNVALIDISPKSIEKALDKFRKENMDIFAGVQNGESTNFADGIFDFVMLNGGVASYTPEPEKLIRETRRILKTNGRIWFDFYNSTGWAIELSEPKRKKDIAASDNELIKMEDWKYPARVMSIQYVERMLHDSGFTIKSKYGLICISHSIPLEFRYSTTYSRELAKEYGEVELALSRREDCIGTAWSCIICAKK